MTTIGKRIKELREERNMTQRQLADVLGIQNTTLSQYESEARTPSDDIKKSLADYFEVSLDYLMGREDSSAYSSFLQKTTIDAENLDPEIRVIQRAKKNSPEKYEKFLDIAKIVFGEDVFKNDKR